MTPGIYTLLMKGRPHRLADIDHAGRILKVYEPIKLETVELVIDQIRRGLNKAEHLVCATIEPRSGRAAYVDLIELITQGTENGKKAKPADLEKKRRARSAQGQLKRSGLTRRELTRRLNTTMPKVDRVMNGENPMPKDWAQYLKNRAKQATRWGSTG